MFSAKTRGTILKADFTWIIQNTLKWPGSRNESLDSPLSHADNEESIKWGLKIQQDFWERSPTLALCLCLFECPTSEPSITARFTISVTDEKEGKLLFKKKSDPVSFTVFNGDFSLHGCLINLLIGNREELLNIPSVLIRVVVEYEKETITTLYHNATISTTSSFYGSSQRWSTDFENLFTSQTSSDISFIVTGQVFRAHKLILSARSPVFAAMFQSDMKEKGMDHIVIPEMAPDIFRALLRFIYTDQVQFTESNVPQLLAAANQFLLPSLKSKCEEFIMEYLSTENCIEMLTLADLHNALPLKRKATELFQYRRTEICKTEGWKNLKKFHPDAAFDIMEHLLSL